MASFTYIAIGGNGKEKKGVIEASSKEIAVKNLKSGGLIPLSVDEKTGSKALEMTGGRNNKKGKIKSREYSIFCSQFKSLLTAGVTILDCLSMLAEQTENKTLQKGIKELQTNVEKGETLTDAMKMQKGIFPTMLISMVEAGEASGSLETSFDRMALQFQKDAALKGAIKKAMTYPAIVGVVTVGAIIAILTFVIPSFSQMFLEMGMELPFTTRSLIVMSDFMKERWYIVFVGVAVIVFASKMFFASPAGKYFLSYIGLKIPAFRDLVTKSSAARLSRTLSTLLAAGVPLLDALEFSSKATNNVIISNAIFNTREEVSKGMPLSIPLKNSTVFPPLFIHMTKIGEESGNMESVLDKVATYYEEEVENATQTLVTVMQPVIILLVAAIVGYIIMAIMQPMISMYSGLNNL